MPLPCRPGPCGRALDQDVPLVSHNVAAAPGSELTRLTTSEVGDLRRLSAFPLVAPRSRNRI